MTTFNAYAALAPHSPLQPFSFDPGKLGADEVEIKEFPIVEYAIPTFR